MKIGFINTEGIGLLKVNFIRRNVQDLTLVEMNGFWLKTGQLHRSYNLGGGICVQWVFRKSLKNVFAKSLWKMAVSNVSEERVRYVFALIC